MSIPLVAAMVDVRRGERAAVALATCGFFLILCAYFVLRPVREAMGIERNFDDLYWLWIATFVGMLAANAVFAVLASKVSKRLLASLTYRLFGLTLTVFVLILTLFPGLLHTHFAVVPWVDQPLTVGHVFYVWLSVFNLLAVSIFWSQASDHFTLEQAKRLFPILAAGGTAGALAGAGITFWLAEALGPVVLMAGSLVMFRLAIWVCDLAFRNRGIAAEGAPGAGAASTVQKASRAPERLNAVRALGRVFSSSYLVGISGWMFALAIAASLLYFTQAEIISDKGRDLRQNIVFFAQIDLFTQGFTLVLQLTVTTALFRFFGVGRMLLLCPITVVACYATLSIWPTYAVMAIYGAMFRSARYAITRPARESLFVVLSSEEKYVSKAALDTVVYRAGDVAGLLVSKVLKEFGATFPAVVVIITPLAVVWSVLGLWLGRRQKALGQDRAPVASVASVGAGS